MTRRKLTPQHWTRLRSQKDMNQGGVDTDTHHLVLLKESPDSLVELRKELCYHPDITEFAQKGSDFSECLGLIAVKLDIALDGVYDCGPLCEILVAALRNKRFGRQTHQGIAGLTQSELIETETSLELSKHDPEVSTILPKDAIVVHTNEPKVSVPTFSSEPFGIGGSDAGTAGGEKGSGEK